jgi:hypothetical protein
MSIIAGSQHAVGCYLGGRSRGVGGSPLTWRPGFLNRLEDESLEVRNGKESCGFPLGRYVEHPELI